MTETQNQPKALIAMSGGVDSSVAAWLMQQAGCECTGVTMRLTRNETLGQSGFHTCCSERDIEDAAEVAFAMDIPYEVVDFTADFREKIIEKFIRVYEAGGTPNPCIDCNKYMKFDHLLRWADAHGIDYVVTGHYARVEQDEATGRWLLKKGLDENKDQSYVLYNLTQEQLAHVRLPLGGLHKSEDICFVPDRDYAKFMEDFTGKHYPPGDFLDENGSRVGTHQGAVRYTIGQRKGLGLAMGAPVYVCAKDMQANTVTVGPEDALFDRVVYADEVNWIRCRPGWRDDHECREIRRNYAGSIFPHAAAAGCRGNGKITPLPSGCVWHRRCGWLYRGGIGPQRRGSAGPDRRR